MEKEVDLWKNTKRMTKFDLILTDPPYDFKQEKKEYVHSLFQRFVFPGRKPHQDGTIIVFSPPENQWILPADQYLFWQKPISTKNTSKRYSRFVEMIFVYQGDNPTWISNRHWSQYTNVFVDLVDNSSIHPFRKPPSLIERLILNHTEPGDWILDPFAGSFVVHDVARRLDRNSVSIEQNPEYF